MKRTRDQIINTALELASLWEKSLIDAMRGCNAAEDLEAVAYSKENIRDFKKIQESLVRKMDKEKSSGILY